MIQIDLDAGTVTVAGDGGEAVHPLGSAEAFRIVSRAWLRAGWDAKHVYSFTWMGRPMIQLPEDMIRAQEVIYAVKPSVIIETGVAHGGSLTFYAALLKAMGAGRVIGIDIEIRPHNRRAIEAHELSPLITLVEGSSTAPSTVAAVRALLQPADTVFTMLDSNHTRHHVLDELHAYADLVTPGSYLVAADGIMADLVGAPRSGADWASNNPQTAVREFLETRSDFTPAPPRFAFNEGRVTDPVTYWPGGWLQKRGK
ncbi:MAG: cephalosporin hydroxylase family protein [Candidatus Dormibacteraeota bacterium]|nr:cephalosporin hydroxylase family protein [Candidatus Dormibacteraeota bacterium]